MSLYKGDWTIASCLNCEYDLLEEDGHLNFICELKVANDDSGDFIENPKDFFCKNYKPKDTVVERR